MAQVRHHQRVAADGAPHVFIERLEPRPARCHFERVAERAVAKDQRLIVADGVASLEPSASRRLTERAAAFLLRQRERRARVGAGLLRVTLEQQDQLGFSHPSALGQADREGRERGKREPARQVPMPRGVPGCERRGWFVLVSVTTEQK